MCDPFQPKVHGWNLGRPPAGAYRPRRSDRRLPGDHVLPSNRDGRRPGRHRAYPISSLGQAVILPTIFGWDHLVEAQSQPESFFLAFLVGLHVATSTALLIYFWSEWRLIIGGLFRTLDEGVRDRKA